MGLSLSPCHRRVRALELNGVIQQYRAHIDPGRVGLGFSAIVFVTLRESSHDSIAAFETALLTVPQVVQAERLFGDPDYMLHVLTRDLSSFQQLYDEQLSALPLVLRLRTTLVMKKLIQNRPVPI